SRTMVLRALILTLAVALTAPSLAGQSAPTAAVIRLDPALDALISADATVEVLKEDYFGATEGPVWVKDGPSGYLLFSDQAANRVYKWAPDGTLSVFLEKSGFTGDLRSVNLNGAVYNLARL